MKAEIAVFGLLGLASFLYLKKVDSATKEIHSLLKQDFAQAVENHEDRLLYLEATAQDVPKMQKDIEEIKEILLAWGRK